MTRKGQKVYPLHLNSHLTDSDLLSVCEKDLRCMKEYVYHRNSLRMKLMMSGTNLVLPGSVVVLPGHLQSQVTPNYRDIEQSR